MAESNKQPAPRRLNLEIPADIAATYANFAIITHSPWEVFVDFAQILPNTPKARVKARIVMTPTNAKMLLNALQDNLTRYEAQHGDIVLPQRPQSLADQLFGTIRSSSGPDIDDGQNADDDDAPDEDAPDEDNQDD